MKRTLALLIVAVSLAFQTAPVAAQTWSPTGTMNVARAQHTESYLPTGQVLIAGGGTATAELYNPTTGVFTLTTGSMSTARSGHTATLLLDGTVLIAGGENNGTPLNTAEIYNPDAGTFTLTTGNMNSARSYHTATLLPDGTVLIAGGWDGTATLDTAEIYDPTSGTFTSTENDMPDARQQHTATLLDDGTVLIAGGTQIVEGDYTYLNSAALYTLSGTPLVGSFSATVSMSQQRCDHTATLLQDGTVLVTAGFGPLNGTFGPLASAELYNPSTESPSFTSVGSLATAIYDHTATLLNNGSVLIAGGQTTASGNAPTASAELYNPVSQTFSSTASMIAARWLHAAALLPSGNVLVTGGENQLGAILSSAEIFLDVPPQPINTTQNQPSELTYNFGPYDFVVDYYGDSAYSGLSLAATPLFMTPGQFSSNRLANTPYSSATCSIVNGTGGNCVVFELTCQNTATGATVTCPPPTNTSTTYTFTINWDTTDNTTGWSITNTALLEAEVGTNNWDNIQTFFSPTRTDDPDPTTSGRTPPGYSDFVFVYNVSGTAPTITITSPQNGAVYAVGENVLADYSCSGLYVVSCVGNVPAGIAVDTSCASSNCSKTFTVNATVSSGPAAVESVNYSVSSTVSADTVSISAPAITYGAVASVTVSVTSAAGTVPGSVSLGVDGGSSLTQPLSGGSTVFTISGLGGGSHSLSASYAAQGAFVANSATGTLQVNPASQTITVTTSAPITASYGTTFPVAATASSGLLVAITTSGACSGGGSGSATITITSGTGSCVVYFDQEGSANYCAAPEMTNSTTATPGSLASFSPSSINFGTVYLGTITVKTVTVTNAGDAPMTISTPFFSILSGGVLSEFVAVNLCPKSLAAGKSCTIAVSFIAGPYYALQTATLNVVDNAPGSPQTVALSATVINPKVSLSSCSLNFGKQKVGTKSAAQTVTLTNTGTGTTPLALSTLAVSGNYALASATTCVNGETLAPKGSCTIAVEFTPTATGPQQGSVVITDNAQNSPQIVLLSGTGD